MLIINTKNSFFDILFSFFFFAGFAKNAFGDENISFFFFWYVFNIVSNQDFKKLSSKC